MNDFQKTAKELLDFIEKSPTCFHAVANIGAMLEEAGYVRLRENEEWKLVKGGKYYTERNDSSVIAFAVPTGTVKGFHMAAAHSDSPCFKVKEKPELTVEDHYMRLNTEKYGGMILSTWMDRPLSVAGRLAVRGTDGIQSRLVNIDRDLCVIPNVAIHMNREMNKGVEYNPQVDMLPLFADVAFDTDAAGTAETADGPQEKPALLGLAAEAAGVDAEAILGEDLFLYIRQEGRFLGAEGEFVLAPRLDDLQRSGYHIIQNPKKFCFGMDAVLLSGFAKAKPGDNVLDIGTGTGVIPILMAAKTKAGHFTGLEIQHESADMAMRSIRYNHLEERISIVEGDIKEAGTLFASASFHVVTSNPPYMIEHHGLVNPDNAKMIARHEVYCTLEDIIVQTAKLLKNSGKFYLVHRPFRLAEIFYLLVKYGLEPKRMQMVHPYIDKEPNMVLIEAMKGAKSRITCEPPLIVYEKPGVYTKQIYDIYGYNDARVKEHSER